MKKQKIELIRSLERDCGFQRFKVNIKSNEEDINNVLNYVRSIIIELNDHYKQDINNLLEHEK
jgi:hypothetical protein